ncbi:MAG: hypothetical protein JWQ43_2854 [Glaciihabitans sp.]|nr:hypothetical protein [Glaciihabitans sp.]
MTILDFVGTTPTVRPGIALVDLSNTLRRVTRHSGEVLGYIETVASHGDEFYRARRLLSHQSTSLPLGDFWRLDDAIDCFRL